METQKTAVNWLIDALEEWGEGRIKWPQYLWDEAEEMERRQHGETWNEALIQDEKKGFNFLRTLIDFDEYWKKRNIPDSEGVGQAGLPEGGT